MSILILHCLIIKTKTMRKILLLAVVVLMPQLALHLYADPDDNLNQDVLIFNSPDSRPIRSLNQDKISCCYVGLFATIQIVVYADLGNVEMSVTNYSTGEMWDISFDSTAESQIILPISGCHGFYEILFQTESGDVFEGSFTIE